MDHIHTSGKTGGKDMTEKKKKIDREEDQDGK
jgi:hypothetical protein